MTAIFATIILGLTLNHIACEPSPDANNVCNSTVIVPSSRTVKVPVSYEVRYDGMCHGGLIPCEKKRVETFIDHKVVQDYEKVSRITCCDGYAETPDKKCAPICLDSCNNGKCIAPNTCECNPAPTDTAPGYLGPTCKRFVCLSVGKWGESCDKECDCPANSYCSASTGKCICRSGFRGQNCTEECVSPADCEDVFLPPVIEPESNYANNVMGQSQRLEALDSRSFEKDEQRQSITTVASMETTVFLLVLVCFMAFTLVWYRKELNHLRNELNYGPYSVSSTNSGDPSQYSSSYYSAAGADVRGRPEMPLPDQFNFLNKNLSFAATTRNILTKNGLQTKEKSQHRSKTILLPAVEKSLIDSQRLSEQNLYSEISSEEARNISKSNVTLNLSGNCRTSEDHYQVPKSPRNFSNQAFQSVDQSQASESNIYEEIKPFNN